VPPSATQTVQWKGSVNVQVPPCCTRPEVITWKPLWRWVWGASSSAPFGCERGARYCAAWAG
jgi:hypothetical protein